MTRCTVAGLQARRHRQSMSDCSLSPATCTEVAIAYNEELTSQEARKTPKKQAEARARVAAYEKLKDSLPGLDEALVEKFEAKQRRKITSKERAAAIVAGVVSEHVKLELGTRIKDKIVPACIEKFQERNRCEHPRPPQRPEMTFARMRRAQLGTPF